MFLRDAGFGDAPTNELPAQLAITVSQAVEDARGNLQAIWCGSFEAPSLFHRGWFDCPRGLFVGQSPHAE